MTLSVEDRLDLMSLPGRYGNAMDDRNWSVLREIFTPDAVFEVLPMRVRMEGLEEIIAFMDMTDAHPLAHLMVNVDVHQKEEATFIRFRAILPVLNDDGSSRPSRIGSGGYYDEVVKTPAGWRVRHRLFAYAPRDMVPTPIDLANNRGMTKQLFEQRAQAPSERPVFPAR